MSKQLSNGHYTMPGLYHEGMTRKEVREVMLATGGQILACGHLWDVTAKRLGGGVYRVSTKRVDVPARKDEQGGEAKGGGDETCVR